MKIKITLTVVEYKILENNNFIFDYSNALFIPELYNHLDKKILDKLRSEQIIKKDDLINVYSKKFYFKDGVEYGDIVFDCDERTFFLYEQFGSNKGIKNYIKRLQQHKNIPTKERIFDILNKIKQNIELSPNEFTDYYYYDMFSEKYDIERPCDYISKEDLLLKLGGIKMTDKIRKELCDMHIKIL